MPSAGHLHIRILVFACLMLILRTTHSTAQNSGTLSLSLRFKTVEKSIPVAHLEDSFELIIINKSDEDKILPHPLSSGGYRNLKFQFTNRMDGDVYRTHHREIQLDQVSNSIDNNNGPGSETITIAAGEKREIEIDFSATFGKHRKWVDLPDPNPLIHYDLVAKYSFQPTGSSGQSNKPITLSSEPLEVIAKSEVVNSVLKALKHGDAKQALNLLELYPEWINKSDDLGFTPLIVAVRENQMLVAKWLLDHGANVNLRTYNSNVSAMHVVSDIEMLKLLLDHGGDIDNGPKTPLQFATKNYTDASNKPSRTSWKAIAELLIHRGAVYDIESAIRLSDLKQIKEIGDKDTRGKYCDYDQSLRIAASQGNLLVCKYLIEEHDAEVTQAVLGALEHPQIVRLFIDNGADVTTVYLRSFGGATSVLHSAARTAGRETIQLILDAGADPFSKARDATDDNPNSPMPLEFACSAINLAAAQTIIEHKSFIEGDRRLKQQALDSGLLSCVRPYLDHKKQEREALLELLLSAGANANCVDTKGHSPIDHLAGNFHPTNRETNRYIERLIGLVRQHGGDLDIFSAAAVGDIETLKRLLDANPKSLNASRFENIPVLHMAVRLDRQAVVKLLIDAGIDIELRNYSERAESENDTALHEAVEFQRTEIVNILLEAGANANAKNAYDSTPLHYACGDRNPNFEMIQLLLKHGASSRLENNEGKTALDFIEDSSASNAAKVKELILNFKNK